LALFGLVKPNTKAYKAELGTENKWEKHGFETESRNISVYLRGPRFPQGHEVNLEEQAADS